jgi:hypothetical protein
MHHEVRLERLAPAIDFRRYPQTGTGTLDCLDCRPSPEVDAESAGALQELCDQVRIERLERPPAAIEDDHLSVRPCRDVREFERDVAAADEQQPPRQLVEFEEAVARSDVLGALDRQRHGLGAARDHDVACLEALAADLDGVFRDEARGASVSRDALVGEGLLLIRRHRVGEAALEAHQARPVDSETRVGHALAFQQPDRVHDLGTATQHLLGIAAAQLAGATVR